MDSPGVSYKFVMFLQFFLIEDRMGRYEICLSSYISEFCENR